MSLRTDESFGYVSATQFNPFGEQSPVSFDINIASQFDKPHFRSSPRVKYIRPPVEFPFDGTSLNGLLLGAGVVASALVLYFFVWPRIKKYVR